MSPILTPFDKPISRIKIADCEKLTVPSKSTPWNPENHGNIGVSSGNTCQSQKVSNRTSVPTISFSHQTAAWDDGHSVFGILGIVWRILKILWTCTSSNAVLAQVLFNCLGMGVVWLTWDGCCWFDLEWLLFGSCCSCVCLFFSNLLTFCCLRAAGRLPTDMLRPGVHHAWTKPEIWLSWLQAQT